MGKGAKRASRVEKARVPKQQRSEPPRWFYRVMRLRTDQETFLPKDPRGFSRRDFDEDLSELESESEQEDDAEPVKEHKEDCECGDEDSECDCHWSTDDDTEDDESEKSYDGSDAGDYYSLKRQRDKRKREKLWQRQELRRREKLWNPQGPKNKNEQLVFEKSKEEEVRSAFKSLRKARKEHRTIPIESLADQEFKLFCSDYVDHFYHIDPSATKRLHFFTFRNADVHPDGPLKKRGDQTVMYGVVALEGNVCYQIGPFRPRRNASWRPMKVKSNDGKYELSFQFLGNGYLKLRISRDMFTGPYATNPAAPRPTAPEVFNFVGIWCDQEKEKAERQKIEDWKKAEIRKMEWEWGANPPARPTWFELNHPMGALRQGGEAAFRGKWHPVAPYLLE